MRRIHAAAVAAILLLSSGGPLLAQERGKPGEFDYYLYALSWTPAYCAREGKSADPRQCATGGERAGFVLHGLWPQWNAGGWPERCTRDRSIPKRVADAMLEIMPTPELVEHQWTKHGTCSGLPPDLYFADAMAAWERVRIPPEFVTATPGTTVTAQQVEKRFVEVNFDLTPARIATVCDRQGLYEIRICMDKDLVFRDCGAKVEDRCRPDQTLTVR